MKWKVVKWLGWAAVWLTAIFFLQNGVQKMVETERMIEMFQELGLKDWMRIAVGCAEVIGALGLLWPRFTLAAAIGLAVLMIGAVTIELVSGRTFEALIPAQWLVVFVLIGSVRYWHMFRKRRRGEAANV